MIAAQRATRPNVLTGLFVVRGARRDRQAGECGRVGKTQTPEYRISQHYGWIAETHKDECQRQMAHGQVRTDNQHNESSVTR
jgi:hypothetical protein